MIWIIGKSPDPSRVGLRLASYQDGLEGEEVYDFQMIMDRAFAPDAPDAGTDQRGAFDATIELARKHGMELVATADISLSMKHLLEMQADIHAGNFSPSKLGRWLGWAQAALVAANVGITLDDVKALNQKYSDGDRPKQNLRKEIANDIRAGLEDPPERFGSFAFGWMNGAEWAARVALGVAKPRSPGAEKVQDANYTRWHVAVANAVQQSIGRGVMPSTVKAVLEAAGVEES